MNRMDVRRAMAQDAVDFAAAGTDPRETVLHVIDVIKAQHLYRVGDRLERLLTETWQLIGRCDAPNPRADELCGRYFVRERAEQMYCTRRCQARVATQRARVRETPTCR